MYIFELISKLKNKNKNPQNLTPSADLMTSEPELEDPLDCEHMFVPIDSTKEVLACSKCGYVIKNNHKQPSVLDKNPFN